jgi:hypothetical protein
MMHLFAKKDLTAVNGVRSGPCTAAIEAIIVWKVRVSVMANAAIAGHGTVN